ncbi:hypothetical protein KGY72_07790, partial [Candidatus Bipolaricaulota bacterium]|nr:hypothetical protein [Candidatus Bipolaricaulota bacterium]
AYLTGSWMLTLNPPQADPSTQACIFSPNLTAAEPQGTVLCTSVQLPVMEGRGKQAANTVGSWNRTSNGTYEMRAVRMVYNENAKVLSRTVALAELQYASEDGTRILKGTGKVIAESPQGKTLQTIPDIELRAEPMTGLSEYDIP